MFPGRRGSTLAWRSGEYSASLKGPYFRWKKGGYAARERGPTVAGRKGESRQGEGGLLSLKEVVSMQPERRGPIAVGRRGPTAAWRRGGMLQGRRGAYCLLKNWGVCCQG